MSYDAARIRARLTRVNLTLFFRIVRTTRAGTPLEAIPTPSRFSDPKGVYSVLYASEAVRCSFWEAIVRNRFDRRKRRELPRSEIESRTVVEIESTSPLQLVDLRGDGPIRIAAPTAVAHDANHAAGRALSAAVYAGVTEADGFLFQSRFTGHACVAIFDRAFSKLRTARTGLLATYSDVLDALDDYDISLTAP